MLNLHQQNEELAAEVRKKKKRASFHFPVTLNMSCFYFDGAYRCPRGTNSTLTSTMGPAGLQAGDGDTVSSLRGVREVRQAAAPVLHSPDRTVLQPRHDVPDCQAPRTIGHRTLVRTHRRKYKRSIIIIVFRLYYCWVFYSI